MPEPEHDKIVGIDTAADPTLGELQAKGETAAEDAHSDSD